MIICPNCKEEIDDKSHYCDQCGQKLAYCERCGRVGIGRRCTSCGGLMLAPGENKKQPQAQPVNDNSVSNVFMSHTNTSTANNTNQQHNAHPQLMLYNDSLGIRLMGINGAIIGRKHGPYASQLKGNGYISGEHAQLRYNSAAGWCITDKHSSNGTKLNEHKLQPDVEMSLKNGDILSIANVALKVSIS